jgi:hypothetical protein
MGGLEVPLAARSCNGGPSFTARHLAVSRETITKLAEFAARVNSWLVG